MRVMQVRGAAYTRTEINYAIRGCRLYTSQDKLYKVGMPIIQGGDTNYTWWGYGLYMP